MYIKQIQIQGFKSYKDQTAVDPFSPGHNVIVGRNGSGKSNFFSAIRFVLSDQYATLTREERQGLLHDSSSSTSTTLSAFVEITFDNADNRFPTNGEEVILRRTIGLKKDEYSIDRRSASKADVGNLLEAAGFSRANPYYIVPQGRITHLTNAKDHERLDLLKEVAGTRVYEQRRSESLKIMEDTEGKRAKIHDLLDYIEGKIAELDEDKEELREYYKRDKERRCLEYTIYQRELEDVAEVLERLEEERVKELGSSSAQVQEYNEASKVALNLEERVAILRQNIEKRQVEKAQAEQGRRELTKALAELQMLVSEMEEAGDNAAVDREAAQKELEYLDAQINNKEAELMSIKPQWEERGKDLSSVREELERIKARIRTLHSKQGRAAQFKSKAERDKWLRSQIADLQQYSQAQYQRIEQTKDEIQNARTKLNEAEQRRGETSERIEGRKELLQSLSKEWRAAKEKRDTANEQKKEIWNEEAKLSSELGFIRDQLNVAQRTLAGTMDKATASGISAAEKIASRLGLTGVYGPLYSLFTVDDKYKTAVEVTANTSLFHIVVDTDETAAKVVDVMNKERSGRVTFMPLNRLKSRNIDFPQANDAVLMIKKIQFEARYRPAMEQVFGKTIICPNLEIAGAYVRSHRVDAITLDGDKVERKGALSGGFHDPRGSRIDAARFYHRLKDQVSAGNDRLDVLKQQIVRLEQEVTSHLGQMQTVETKRRQLTESRGPLLDQLTWLRREEESCFDRLKGLERIQAEQMIDLTTTQEQVQSLEQELRSALSDGLSSEEATTLEQLNTRSEELNKSLKHLTRQVSELESTKTSLEIDLDEDLKRRREEIRAQLEGLSTVIGPNLDAGAVQDSDVTARKRDLATLSKRISEKEVIATRTSAALEELSQSLRDAEGELETLRADQGELARYVGKQQKGIERYVSKKQRLAEQRDKCNKNIRDLGVLPEEAFENGKYSTMKPDKLLKMLHKVNESLKQYGHVNKKAVEQWNNFTKQRDQLNDRKAELESSAESIQELIEHLDQRKDEAIERTFKQVSKNFEDIFEKLVPTGRGRLIMQRRVDQNPDAMDIDGDDAKSSIDNYTGVAIKVSFNSKVDEGIRVQQLSGGQKSLVALATVFAIQKCDPAPFYLFDEIDANLDAQYRTAVAAMIHELSENAQFITTTFRPEMVAVAERHYGVLFNAQKISTIRTITRSEAHEFVEASAEPAK
ncbi:putative SMC3 [Tilletiaria anomala UBC 951]|uniref:Structural maintenance of chromosomes protein n=1 Tax=Tilletiaria anomala (strain ATCC 24038 / CBS 436.72 / UBC 951) TaxID=1037660 RepID=A0A066WBM1_TILAU|nr:putative SMC3 [Tilletiaria anomala UBC 951]KDN48180.1 putative SMC3 [Tilletiaria anomala UBC 951]